MDAALEARQLRGERIPQLVGMSVGAKILAAELSRAVIEETKQLCDSAWLAEHLQIDAAMVERLAPLIAACQIAVAQRVARRCTERAEEWLATAYRAEGRADALEEASKEAGETPAAEG